MQAPRLAFPWAPMIGLVSFVSLLVTAVLMIWPLIAPADADQQDSDPSGTTPTWTVSPPPPVRPAIPRVSPEGATTATRARYKDDRLEARILGFRRVLVSQDFDALLEYFHPSQLQARGLSTSLAEFLAGLRADGLRPQGHLTTFLSEERAVARIGFSARGDAKSKIVDIPWMRRDGEWYAQLQPRKAGRRGSR